MSTNLKILFTLTLVHFTGDFYTSFINPLFPVFVDKLGLTLTQIGIIAGIVDLLAFVIQPTIGYLADRFQTRAFIFIGLLLPIVFIPLSGIAPNFGVLLLCVGLLQILLSNVTGMLVVFRISIWSMQMPVKVCGC